MMEDLLKKMTYGHYVITALKESSELKTRDEDFIAAGTVNWAMQVSFSPPFIAIAMGQKSDLNETIEYSKRFTLHLLGKSNKEMVKKFGSGSTIENGLINGFPFSKENGQIILEDTLGYLTCKVSESVHIGDHTIYFGEVARQATKKEDIPLCTMELATQYTEDKANT